MLLTIESTTPGSLWFNSSRFILFAPRAGKRSKKRQKSPEMTIRGTPAALLLSAADHTQAQAGERLHDTILSLAVNAGKRIIPPPQAVSNRPKYDLNLK
jgi:hypothetical protein